MSAVAELQRDIEDLAAQHDKLVHAINRKHQELDSLNAHIKARTADLDRIKAEIQKVKAHFGV
jgi:peptidoglycan hydrolase CwlO-like protein